MMPKPPRNMCNQTITYEPVDQSDTAQTDDWGNPIKVAPITINNCVVQPQTIYSGSNNDRTIVANAVVFLYAGISDPLPTIAKNNVGSVITFEGQKYTLTQIVDNREPFSNELYSYELEVL
ncbi:minor capsid protein [Secundilactobacillus pentosiphilus]|uniref:Minor capsid protein n=1 Tax=Secundilactobacillus pentosiphilus TaxID=1714682 RepID=A0A1Z5IZ22_9LACO|nr:putative minor capsid protein [Secundilactobacillus pentosiphilus]GAX06812.1 minor capsid protein [Secundilactobacillus pentosiphilus]